MITFNQETIDKLKRFETYFYTVLDLQYIRATSRDMLDLLEIYQEAGGKVKNFSYSCYQCRYNLVKEVGLAYRASIKQLEEEKESNSLETNKINTEEDVKLEENSAPAPAKKRGRPRKQ